LSYVQLYKAQILFKVLKENKGRQSTQAAIIDWTRVGYTQKLKSSFLPNTFYATFFERVENRVAKEMQVN
jgi:hypothetical protein